MYGIETRVLNQAIKRNPKRFPPDFMSQITTDELDKWKSRIVTSNQEKMGFHKLPLVFTEYGVAMLSSAVNSETAMPFKQYPPDQPHLLFVRLHERCFIRIYKKSARCRIRCLPPNPKYITAYKAGGFLRGIKQQLFQPEEYRLVMLVNSWEICRSIFLATTSFLLWKSLLFHNL